jgi:hypothetical protein
MWTARSLVENLQVSLVAILRMEVDTLEGQVLAGDTVDLKRLELALGMLRTLLPAQAYDREGCAPAFGRTITNRDPQHWRATASSSSTCSASIGLKVRKTARDSFRIGDGKCRP